MAEQIKPEIIAAIAAAVQAMSGDGKIVSVKIKRNDTWTLAGRLSK